MTQGGDCTKYACTALTLTKKGTKARLVVSVRNRLPGTPQGGCPDRHCRSFWHCKKTPKKNLRSSHSSCSNASACRLGCHAEGKEDAARGTEAQHVVRRCTTHAQDGSSYAFGYSSRCVPRQKETKGDGAEEATKGDGGILLLHRRQNPFQWPFFCAERNLESEVKIRNFQQGRQKARRKVKQEKKRSSSKQGSSKQPK